ncbi:MAG TPA: hypothetical protein PLB51_02380 [Candidatus Paceibacterota bacterium]|nr:hypothetical protein [Candidatus Paceibacterota bacterium]
MNFTTLSVSALLLGVALLVAMVALVSHLMRRKCDCCRKRKPESQFRGINHDPVCLSCLSLQERQQQEKKFSCERITVVREPQPMLLPRRLAKPMVKVQVPIVDSHFGPAHFGFKKK